VRRGAPYPTFQVPPLQLNSGYATDLRRTKTVNVSAMM